MSRKSIGGLGAMLLGTVGLSLVLPLVPANAAEQQLEIVTVTARKRQESILKVPVIETAISERKLSQFATSNLANLSQQVPGLLMGAGIGPFGLQVSLRGIGTTTLNAAIDQSVSLNLDGMQVTQGLAYEVGMFDLAQAEVLEGPQALFYGKASPGGVIALHSADPTDETEVILRGGYEFEAAERTGELILSGPVSDTLKLRLATKYSDQDGFFKNITTGIPSLGGVSPRYTTYSPQTHFMIRGTALWNPIESFDAKLKVNYAKTNIQGDGGGQQIASCPGGTTGLLSTFLGVNFLDPNLKCGIGDTYHLADFAPSAFPYIANNGVPFQKMWMSYGTLQMNYRPWPDITVTSVSGYFILRQSALVNGTMSAEAGSPIAVQNTFFRRDLTEELRVNSDFDGPFNFTAGAFYQDAYINEPIHVWFNTALASASPALTLPPIFEEGVDRIPIHTVSMFGQARYKIFPELELAAGARWTHEYRTFSQYASTIYGVPVTPGYTPLAGTKLSSYHLNPEATLTYTPTDNLTLYASYKEGSKSGSFDTSLILPPGGDASFGDEGVSGFEGGIKGSLFDRRAIFSLAAYSYRYKNLQVGASDFEGGIIVERTLNAASANIHGVEFSASYLPEAIEGLTLNAAASWNHARFANFPNALCWGGQTIAEGCDQEFNPATGLYTAQNLGGRPLVRAPEWTTNFGFDYETSVWNGMTLALASNTLFTGGYYTDLVERYDTYQRAYFKTDFSVTLKAPDDSWEFAVIGNNLNNEIVAGNCTNAAYKDATLFGAPLQTTGGTTSGLEGPDAIGCHVERGRAVWLRLTLRPLDLIH